MSNELNSTSPATRLAQLRQLLGPPPVLSTENMEGYEEMLRRFIECLLPATLATRCC
jgi:hypothetical protein